MRYRPIAARLRFLSITMAMCGLLAVGSAAGASEGSRSADGQVAAGERLYREGITVKGNPVHAVSQNDVPVSGQQAACATCHRPSGLGSSEGGFYAPPINAPLLYAPRKLDRMRLFGPMFRQVQSKAYDVRLTQPHLRPAYTLESLGKTLRSGVDAGGTTLATIMPRYQLTAADVAALDAYLHTLSVKIDPGVDKDNVQFAAVFSDGVPVAKREVMLKTLQAYVKWRNEHRRYNQARPGFSVGNRSEFVASDRNWELAVWDLKGDQSTWQGQLDKLYQAHPVFAVVGGEVLGSWDGPSRFCDAHRIPCLFPDTELPAWPPSTDGYTVYYSAGLVLEAKTIAAFLASGEKKPQVVQIAADDSFGKVPSGILQKALLDSKSGALNSRIVSFSDRAQLDAALGANGADAEQTLVVWPGADVQMVMDALVAAKPKAKQIILPSRAIPAATAMKSDELANRLRFANPYELNPASHYKTFETRAWLRTRRLGQDYPDVQMKAYFAMSMLNSALAENRDDYYRDYLLERIEDVSQNDMNPGIYPAMALGPGDRYAAKRAAIVRFDPNKPDSMVAVSAWFTP